MNKLKKTHELYQFMQWSPDKIKTSAQDRMLFGTAGAYSCWKHWVSSSGVFTCALDYTTKATLNNCGKCGCQIDVDEIINFVRNLSITITV